MIAFLRGELSEKAVDYCIIDASGVGYRVEISGHTSDMLPPGGDEVKLLIYHHITENDQRLFGFSAQKEKNLFERLITVKGIGPKLGLTILSGMNASDLIEAIVTQNTTSLSSISGIGKKTAERMVLELKDKLFDDSGPAVFPSGGRSATRSEEAVSALEALGFSRRDSAQVVGQITSKESGMSVSDLVKQALLQLKR
ncbi:MAG: Holliday junction branch migration protein RuvA [Balneolaceae bacterium]|nr:MAG: Holliday junction branch migration protein RuvA [Balneolaceae bacterium]